MVHFGRFNRVDQPGGPVYTRLKERNISVDQGWATLIKHYSTCHILLLIGLQKEIQAKNFKSERQTRGIVRDQNGILSQWIPHKSPGIHVVLKLH
jgi:hypothetical protein